MEAQLRLIPRSEARRAPVRPPARRGDAPASASTSTTPEAPHHPATDPAEAPAQWRIDDDARERGRAGISRARQALQAARPPRVHERHTTAA
jgi:hypothetical protein